MGSAACFHLARRGHRVLGIERFRAGHAHGSSHGGSRIVRDCYFEAPDYVPLLKRSRELWDELEERTGERLVTRCGVLYAGHPASEVVAGSLLSAEIHGVRSERLTAREARERFPQIRIPDSYRALFEPGGGFVRPEKAVLAHLAEAAREGASLLEDEAVVSWDELPDHVAVRTERGIHEAASLVLCAGAWTPRLATSLGVPLRVARQVIVWLDPLDLAACSLPRMPVWLVEPEDALPVYGIPIADDQPAPFGLKVAIHGGGEIVDPDTVRREVSSAESEEVRAAVTRFIPAGGGEVLASSVCLYTNSPDGHFLIDRLPGHQRVFVACGFSGHGFKFTPIVGEILADLVETGTTRHPADFLKISRSFG